MMKRRFPPVSVVELQRIAALLARTRNEKERVALLLREDNVLAFFRRMQKRFSLLDDASKAIACAMIVVGQSQILENLESSRWQGLIDSLKPVDHFYRSIGGIVGYQAALLKHLRKKRKTNASLRYESPPFIDIRKLTPEVWQSILLGLVSLPQMAEIYPVGGAADRLDLTEGRLQIALPAARLMCLGRTLLEHLITDVQTREYVYYRLFRIQLTTPIAMMTSLEKDNHAHILAMCAEKEWFGRPKESFHFFCQPLVPAINKQEKWCQLPDGSLLMKPGGHGMLWKAAEEASLFDQLQKDGRSVLLVRQINNPIAGCDYGLLAFCGMGFLKNRVFGFSSCAREPKTAEGMNVLAIQKDALSLSSIEYCDFQAKGIEDSEVNALRYPSNTNILYATINAVQKAIQNESFPGMIAQWKRVRIGQQKETIARLEIAMQNIADQFSAHSLTELSTYLTFNERRKTISTAKRKRSPDASFFETPEHCLYDHLCNCVELLEEHAGFLLPPMPSKEAYMRDGPPFLFFYHPALGPLFSIIGKKLCRGRIAPRSELDLHIAEAYLENLSLEGSLQIYAENVMGAIGKDGILRYSEDVGRCYLKNVRIENKGIHWRRTRFFLET